MDLIRHGQAQPTSPAGDRSRQLTDAGRVALKSLADRLGAAGTTPTLAFSSPLMRARQSAKIVLGAFRSPPMLQLLNSLEPEAPVETLLFDLSARDALSGHILLVSHMPLLGLLCAHLTGETPEFSTATVVRIGIDGARMAGGGRVLFTLRPEGH
jgi:phosphohistidine phosphatase SixA